MAAGQGTRLRPHTDHVPKCMVEAAGKPLISWQLEVLNSAGIADITAVCGYKEDKITDNRLNKVVNDRFASTNMVYSLMCAANRLHGNVIIAYGDIIYSKAVLEQLMRDERDLVIACDDLWLDYWSQRFENPLSDAETFKKGTNGLVASLGSKTDRLEDIEGQYIGLIKLSDAGCTRIKEVYQNASQTQGNVWNSSRTLDMAYMTDMLNHLASEGLLAYSPIQRGWIEVDDLEDLKIAGELIPQIVANNNNY